MKKSVEIEVSHEQFRKIYDALDPEERFSSDGEDYPHGLNPIDKVDDGYQRMGVPVMTSGCFLILRVKK